MKSQNNYIAMTSITYAMKARDLLERSGYFCAIERTPVNLGSGCGYSLVFKYDPDIIITQLDNNHIPYKAVMRTKEREI